MFAEASTVLQIDLAAAAVISGAIATGMAGGAKLFTGYLLQRDNGWQEAMRGMSENVARGQADNKELVNVIIRLITENTQTIIQLAQRFTDNKSKS